MKHQKYIIAIAVLALSSCKKLIETCSPKNQLTSEKVFSDSTAATAALTNLYGLYARTIDANYTPYMGLYADELTYTSTSVPQKEFQLSQLNTSNASNLTIWKNQYTIIYGCNDLIESLPTGGLPPTKINQLLGEAKFLRAYSYLMLVSLYDQVPLITTTDVDVNRRIAQSAPAEVYQQILRDLDEAKDLLSARYEGAGKVRANYYCVLALQSKTNLILGNWSSAERTASEIINSSLYTPLDGLDNVFKAGSRESILQFYTQTGFVAGNASLVPVSNTTMPQMPLTGELYNSFETLDQRKSKWIGTSTVSIGGSTIIYRYPMKYKNRVVNTTSPEYLTALRLSEQYLIRAEAMAQQNNLTGAAADLNAIRNRAGLGNVPVTSQAEILEAIATERRSELFVEWANRFIDLKRTGKLNSTLSPLKSTWTPAASALPIPSSELIYNPNLKQNPGYN